MKIFVISDLHLGGRPHVASHSMEIGSQICRSYSELAEFINKIAVISTDEVELVINGDIVDFLMEDDYEGANQNLPWIADEDEVLLRLKKIIERTKIANEPGPFEAMSLLLARGHSLTFILGNHDIELSFPKVRRYLEQIVLKSQKTLGKFRFIYDGEAYTRG